MAATYPQDVEQAGRWSLANPQMQGTQAVRAVQATWWDPSVQSLVAFPRIVQMMANQPAWTQRLGDAFLNEPDQVMATVQGLRQRALAAGSLQTNSYAVVEQEQGNITIFQSDPYVAYAPYYDSGLVYGNWQWPQYPPVVWAPWRGYSERPGFGLGLFWGAGIVLGANFFFGDVDWRRHTVQVHNPNRDVWTHYTQRPQAAPQPWRHDEDPRHGSTRPPERGNHAGPAQPLVAKPVPIQAPPALPDRPTGPAHGLENIGQAAQVRDARERARASLRSEQPQSPAMPRSTQVERTAPQPERAVPGPVHASPKIQAPQTPHAAQPQAAQHQSAPTPTPRQPQPAVPQAEGRMKRAPNPKDDRPELLPRERKER
jgi:hypothetical protein